MKPEQENHLTDTHKRHRARILLYLPTEPGAEGKPSPREMFQGIMCDLAEARQNYAACTQARVLEVGTITRLETERDKALERVGELEAAHANGGDPEFLGRLVRMTWREWAGEQPNVKASWLTLWEDLTDAERDVDRRIGMAVANVCVHPELLRVEAALAEAQKLLALRKELWESADAGWAAAKAECIEYQEIVYRLCNLADAIMGARSGRGCTTDTVAEELEGQFAKVREERNVIESERDRLKIDHLICLEVEKHFQADPCGAMTLWQWAQAQVRAKEAADEA